MRRGRTIAVTCRDCGIAGSKRPVEIPADGYRCRQCAAKNRRLPAKTEAACSSCGQPVFLAPNAAATWKGLCKSCRDAARKRDYPWRHPEGRITLPCLNCGWPCDMGIRALKEWRGRCKACAQVHRWKRTKAQIKAGKAERSYRHRLAGYGLTGEEHRQLMEHQAGGCAICGETENGRRFHVDHNHQTGRVRGLLCHSCNIGIGRLRDDPKLVRSALAYLTADV